MHLPRLENINLDGKIVLMRGDLDTNFQLQNANGEKDTRLESVIETLKIALEKGAEKVVLIGSKGRPGGEYKEKDSLFELQNYLEQKLSIKPYFVNYEEFQNSDKLTQNDSKLVLLENLRFWKGEEDNDRAFAEKIVNFFDAESFVNESFAVSHREHASIVTIPKAIKENGGQCVLGLRFTEEVENLSKVLENPEHPVVTLLSGVKEDKLEYLVPFKKFSDFILVAGRLPEYLGELVKDPVTLKVSGDEKIVLAQLNQDKEDITIYSIERFEEVLKSAKTIIVAGPIGHYEVEGQQLGTRRVFQAVAANTDAFKLAGGGDTEKALATFGLVDNFNWVSVGGGAMLEFLAKGTLPGIEALVE